MHCTDISKELKSKLESNQTQLKNAIRHHQTLMIRLKESDIRFVNEIQDLLVVAQENIVTIGLAQKELIENLRTEYKAFEVNYRNNILKNGVENRRVNLTNSIARARKQNIIPRLNKNQSLSPSDDSEIVSAPVTPDPIVNNPLNPHDITQNEYLTYFGLVTHDIYREIQTKRAERKRRRTANPQFLYTRGWDISKRKRNIYLASNISPPHTRQSTKNKRSNSPPFKTSRPNSPDANKKGSGSSWSSSLIIERVRHEDDVCSECNKPDNLLTCETCTCAFHLTCHNRPLNQTPKHCPKCLKNVLAHEAELNEKLLLRSELLQKNKELTAELTKLEDKHAELEVFLKTRDTAKKELCAAQDSTMNKITTLVKFIETIQKCAIPEAPNADSPQLVTNTSEDNDNPPSVESISSVVSVASTIETTVES